MDDAAVADAFKAYGEAVFRRCLRVLRDTEGARDVTVKWRTHLGDLSPSNLAVVADGAQLTAPTGVPSPTPCPNPGDCLPPVFPLWSSSDGVLTSQLPGVPHTQVYGSATGGWAAFTCNGKDTCAVGLADLTRQDDQSTFVRVYRTDGSALLRVPTGRSIDHMAISPDGNFVTIAMPVELGGPVTVFRIDDGAVAGSHIFSTDTF